MDPAPEDTSRSSRRGMLLKLGVALNAVAGVLLLTPILRYVLSPASKRAARADHAWVTLGPLSRFPEGQTTLATFTNPFRRPWDGKTDDIPCWVRRIGGEKFQV